MEGTKDGRDWEIDGPRYRIQTHRLCESLQRNKSVQCLRLLGVSFDVAPKTTVGELFLDLLDKNNNTALEYLELCDDKFYYTTMHRSSWKRKGYARYVYKNFEAARQIQYLLSLNAHGRATVQDKNTTVGELVNLLDKVVGTETQLSVRRQIVDLATTQQFASDTNSAESCSQLYDMLRKSPKLWSDGPLSEIVGIVYDLLHESLSLWSHPAGVGSLPEACSRKRLRSE